MIYQERYNGGPFPDVKARAEPGKASKEERAFRRGDVYMADLGGSGPGEDHVQGGVRPVIVLQNDAGCVSSPTVVVVPVTSRIRKDPDRRTHFLIRRTAGLSADSIALGEQITTINKKQCLRYLGRLSRNDTDGVLSAALSGMDGYPPPVKEADLQGNLKPADKERRKKQ